MPKKVQKWPKMTETSRKQPYFKNIVKGRKWQFDEIGPIDEKLPN